jgi:predicted nucleic acid-binding protein
MTADRPVLVDTNVLLTACSPNRRFHTAALTVLNDWPNRGIRLLTSGQILREYLVVATRPASSNGLGLSVATALRNLEALRQRLRLLEETAACSTALVRLVREIGCEGKVIHDANLVATLLAHGESRLVTANSQDFRRFDHLVEVIDLA